jgi:hypothetical protein
MGPDVGRGSGTVMNQGTVNGEHISWRFNAMNQDCKETDEELKDTTSSPPKLRDTLMHDRTGVDPGAKRNWN